MVYIEYIVHRECGSTIHRHASGKNKHFAHQANFLLSPNLFEVAKSKGWQLGRRSVIIPQVKGWKETIKYFCFYPYLGKWSNLTYAYFSNGLVQPPSRSQSKLWSRKLRFFKVWGTWHLPSLLDVSGPTIVITGDITPISRVKEPHTNPFIRPLMGLLLHL